MLGDIGAAGRAARTIIGEAVNAASRLEAETKLRGVEALISEAVLSDAGLAVPDEALLTLELRGVQVPVRALALAQVVDLRDRISDLTPGP